MREWTEQHLQQVAGWKAVKAGKELWQLGRLDSVRATAEKWFASCREGKRQHRFCVPTNPANSDLLRCSCTQNSSSGAMCAHLVALALEIGAQSSRKQTAQPQQVLNSHKTQASVSHVDVAPVQCFRISFYSHWQREWQQGSLSIKVEKSQRQQIDEADRDWQTWWLQQGSSQGPGPWVLSLRGKMLDHALMALIGHSEVNAPDGPIEISAQVPMLEIASRHESACWHWQLISTPGIFLGQECQRWLCHHSSLYAIEEKDNQQLIHQIFTQKYLKIADSDHITISKLLPFLRWSDDDPLAKLDMKEVRAITRLHIDGSERSLQLRVELSYEFEMLRHASQLTATDLGILAIETSAWLIADSTQQQEWRLLLKRMGWQLDSTCWILKGEETVQQFLCSGLPALQKIADQWLTSARFDQLMQSLEILQLSCDWSQGSHEVSQLRLKFHSLSGRAYDPQKIRQLLQSGKKIINTAQGKRLLLPAEQWDLLQRLVTDTNTRVNGDAYDVPNAATESFHYFRQYTQQPLQVNDNLIPDWITVGSVALSKLGVQLRDYQIEGVRWILNRLQRYGAALLADEMGLGKTMQTIAVIQQLQEQGSCALVVVPTSLLRNWQEELQRATPNLRVKLIHGSQRELNLLDLAQWDVLITSFGVLVRDRAWHLRQRYGLMVVDEASLIRNPETDSARTIFRIPTQWRIALTGTPIENGLRDLWSIFHYLRPGLLGERTEFSEKYEKLAIDAPHRANVMQALRWRLAPMILRREKQDVARDLPEKIEIDQWCDLSSEQNIIYQQLVEDSKLQISQSPTQADGTQHMQLLTLLLRLRQVCCDLSLVDNDSIQNLSLEQRSSKMERLLGIVEQTLASERKMLIFSQFSQQLQHIERELNNRSIECLRLDGRTQNRHEMVQRFQQDNGPRIFLISLKAGGYGLNLTQASVVVHFDPWWNPAAEAQASDRAHRIGQNRHVTVHRLLTRGTIEEQVRTMQWDKRQIAAGLHASNDLQSSPSTSDLRHLLQSAAK